MAKCITVVFGRFFEAEGKDVEEARVKLRKKIKEWMKEEGMEGRYIIDILCSER